MHRTFRFALSLFVSLSLVQAGEEAAPVEVADEVVTALVDQTCADLVKDADGTIAKINAGEHPYKDKEKAEHYVFVYDAEVNMVAHPDKNLVGKNFKGKPDAKGKKFRDEIVEGALKSGTGWCEYMYKKPNAEGLYPKKAYYKLVEAGGKKLIVICGKYLPKA